MAAGPPLAQEHVAPGEPVADGQPSSRGVVLAASALLVVVLAAVAALLPVPYVMLEPGPMTNTLGSVEGKELITVTGRRTYPTGGHLDLTTVSVSGGPGRSLDLVSVLRGWVDPDVAVIPEEQVYPDGTTEEQVQRGNERDMTTSQEDATAAALRQLGIPVTERATVAAVAKGSPADGVLEEGDVITEVDGTRVAEISDVGRLINRVHPGTAVTLALERAGRAVRERVGTRAAGGDGRRAVVGVSLGTTFRFPFPVRFGLKDVGGPSAGLMFALGIVDKLTPGLLNGGAYVAGTGEISPDGSIGPIGGIQQKLVSAHEHGAALFLAPRGNCPEVRAAAPAGLRVVDVATLRQAVAALDALRAGDVSTLPSCRG